MRIAFERAPTVADCLDAIVLAEHPAQVFAHVGVVVADQHPCGGGARRAGAAAGISSTFGARPVRLRRRAASATLPRHTASAPMLVDDELPRRAQSAPAADAIVPAGMVTVNVVPRPSVLCDGDAAAVQPYQLLHEREADAGAFVRPRARVLHAVEPLEHARQVGCGNADAGVAHATARPGRRATRSATVMSPSNVNLNAFESRLSTIFSHMSRST